jgi:hypothetical protein
MNDKNNKNNKNKNKNNNNANSKLTGAYCSSWSSPSQSSNHRGFAGFMMKAEPRVREIIGFVLLYICWTILYNWRFIFAFEGAFAGISNEVKTQEPKKKIIFDFSFLILRTRGVKLTIVHLPKVVFVFHF